jgi:RNA polymerase sigma-70 factor (ECF subfamily)
MGSVGDYDELYAAGRAAWPNIALDRERFAKHVAAIAPEEAPPIDRAGDVYLACACALAVQGAIEAFEKTYANDIARTVARINKDQAFVRDATQAVRERLLIARPDAPPRIGEYGGRAALRAWLASAATRVALNLRRGKAEQAHEELRNNANMIAHATAPELAVLRARYKDDFEEAIR